MTKDDLSMLLTQSEPGEEITVPQDELAGQFPPHSEGKGPSEQGLRAAAEFAAEHNCDFSFIPVRGEGIFRKRPNPERPPMYFGAVRP